MADDAQERKALDKAVKNQKAIKRIRKRLKKRKKTLRGLERMARCLDGNPETALLTTLGIAPAFATSESMLTASQAQGQLMLGAVAQQQRLGNIATMSTAACVAQMLKLSEAAVDDYDPDFDNDSILAALERINNGGE